MQYPRVDLVLVWTRAGQNMTEIATGNVIGAFKTHGTTCISAMIGTWELLAARPENTWKKRSNYTDRP